MFNRSISPRRLGIARFAPFVVVGALGIVSIAQGQTCNDDLTCDAGETVFSCPMDCSFSVCTQTESNCQAPDRTGAGPTGTIGATSDANIGAGFFVADNFRAAATGSITNVCWWGFYLDFDTDGAGGKDPDTFDCGPGTGDQFRITYFENVAGGGAVAGLPGIELDSFNVTASKAATGNTIASGVGDIVEYEYSAFHAPFPVLAGECYWIEIRNFSSGDCFWLWQTAPAGDEQSFQDDEMSGEPNDGYDAGDASTYDLAFCVNVDIEPDGGCNPSAPNDDCDNAIDISAAPTGIVVDTTYGTTDGTAEMLCNFGGSGQVSSDFWYRYVSDCDDTVTVSLTPGTLVNPKLAVYQFACPSVVNNALGCSNTGMLSVDLLEGVPYYIRVGAEGTSQGTAILNVFDIADPCTSPPVNDSCGGASTAAEGATPFTSLGATSDGPDESGCDGSASIENDVWLRWFSLCDGEEVTISASGDFDTKVAVYAGNCPAGPDTAIACSDNGAGDGSVTFTGVNFTLYRIRVGSASGATGSGTVTISCGSGPACPGDVNGDLVVDVDDIVEVVLDFASGLPDGNMNGIDGDCNSDGVVDIDDIVCVIVDGPFGNVCN